MSAAALPGSGALNMTDHCVLVIFGASGDLTTRKLVPALFRLSRAGSTPRGLKILGVGKDDWSTEQFRAHMYEGASVAEGAGTFSDDDWIEFVGRLHYVSGDLTSTPFYVELAERLGTMREPDAAANRLFYCSTPPSLAGPIVGGLKAAGLSEERDGWARIIIEKPFGHDLSSARALNAQVANAFEESQIYRIDHYLGKETVQNILVLRFGNSIFEPLWNRNYVEYVEISAVETLGIGNRAGYYEEAGALRDMVANHLLQLLALTAMEPPVAFDADSVREQKVQVLRSILPMRPAEVEERTVRGQYRAGTVGGTEVCGYREERGVAADSLTETYVAVMFFVQNWRWSGVPFYLRSGKRLARQLTEINIHFKRTPHALFARTPEDVIEPNVMTLRLQPDEAIRMTFGAKRPGTDMRTGTVQMDFAYETGFGVPTAAAYETLLLDAMRGDATLFTRRDEVEAEWKLITPIEDAWQEAPPPEFPNYDAGTDGPVEADEMLAREGHAWRPLTKGTNLVGHLRTKGRTGVLSWPVTRRLR